MNYDKYEELRLINKKRNEELLKNFSSELMKKGFTEKTIRKHIVNVDFYIDDFLTYYDVKKAEDGISYVSEFLGDWFIRKAMWSTENTIKQNIASLKKFYKFLHDELKVSKEDYDLFLFTIKEEKDEWINSVNTYNNFY